MTTALAAPLAADDLSVSVCRVAGSVAVHLLVGCGLRDVAGPALCGGVVVPGRPEHLLLKSPCTVCVSRAEEQGIRTVRDGASAWINLGRLAVALRTVA